jgi:hypothetical protein
MEKSIYLVLMTFGRKKIAPTTYYYNHSLREDFAAS